MIPEFPKFKKLEITDKEEVEKITSQFPPYSDFNFTSLWCWDLLGETKISELKGNLVVKFSDYLTGAPFYSFIGNQNVDFVLGSMAAMNLAPSYSEIKLKLIVEDSVSAIKNKERYKITHDPDNYDYVFSNKDI